MRLDWQWVTVVAHRSDWQAIRAYARRNKRLGFTNRAKTWSATGVLIFAFCLTVGLQSDSPPGVVVLVILLLTAVLVALAVAAVQASNRFLVRTLHRSITPHVPEFAQALENLVPLRLRTRDGEVFLDDDWREARLWSWEAAVGPLRTIIHLPGNDIVLAAPRPIADV